MWYIIKILHWRFGYLKQKKLYAKSVGFSEIASEFLLEPTSAAWGMSGISFEKL